ncbi:unnamed protein product [Rotaria socialis]|uniref:Nuclear receptor domain-containing protein n=1 Tax=Rotaria socialis TaxID=392032 RepID=A0A817UU96_9BILA|nr:unnamed protein product [Rotaria socialis]CAF3335959.1 unnamed protein product [Rotaria socialis]CAF3356126.1 unnamed protein product [Rotaria socialis]CAF3358395.1 unnamed protein product [Rotaria socialis]CAF3644182.1 unnamed protein product [Rotaria socialis]
MNSDYVFVNGDNFIYDLETNNKDTFDAYLSDAKQRVTNMSKRYDASSLNYNECGKKTEKTVLQCVVCGAKAFGYNFDRITCESCKAFFRRNALRNMVDLQCRFGGKCDITAENRRHCTYCRIRKCFTIGMRKDWIRSEKEKNKKLIQGEKQRKTKQTKRRLQISMPRDSENFNSPVTLSSADRASLNNISHCYDQYAGEPSISVYSAPQQVLTLRLHEFYNRKKPIVVSFISYFKHLPEFQQLNIDDQVLLIKQNIHILLPVNYALLKTPAHSQFRYTRIQTAGCVNNINLHSMYQLLSNTFVPFVTLDPLVVKLFLIILFLTTNLLTTNFDTVGYKQLGYIHRIQSAYTQLLWLYMIEKYGEKRAVILYTRIITTFLHLQTVINRIDSIIRLNKDTQYLDSLMKSILQLT